MKEEEKKFWNYLDKEVESAASENIGIVIQIDSNAWAGSDIIPNDPNPQNLNRKLLKLFLERNKNITLFNSQHIYEGLITRTRTNQCSTCSWCVIKIFTCEQNVCGQARFAQAHKFFHKQGKVTETDHATLVLHINLKFQPIKPQRFEEYNFRSTECQNRFNSLIN